MNHATFVQFRKQLAAVEGWFERAEQHARDRSFDANTLLTARLAPDQFPFARQVQGVCDVAKFAAARLTGKEAPAHPDTETTLDELRARVRSVLAYLDGFTATDFDAAATRVISLPRWEGKTMSGANYFLQHALPNFYFHLTHVYAILRHNGVNLGKRDYLGALSLEAPAT